MEGDAKFADATGATTPLGLLRYALEYFTAAHATDDAIGDDVGHEVHAPMVVNFLIGQALELAFKAYLLSHRVGVDELRRTHGHDLLSLYDASNEKGFGSGSLRSSDRFILGLLNVPYKARELQYFKAGRKEAFPVFGPLNEVASEILHLAMAEVPDAQLLKSRKASDVLERFPRRRPAES